MPGLDTERDRRSRSVNYVREHWWVAVLLVPLSGVGAALVLWHWWHTQLIRPVELEGFFPSQRLDAPTTLLFQEWSSSWWPVAGLVLLSCGGLLGAVVMAGPLARQLSAAAGWTLLLLAAPLRIGENHLLESRTVAGASANTIGLWLQGVAFLGLALTSVAGLVAVMGAGTAALRLVIGAYEHYKAHQGRETQVQEQGTQPGETANTLAATTGPASSLERLVVALRQGTATLRKLGLEPDTDGSRRPRSPGDDAHWRKSSALPPGRKPHPWTHDLGICLSGGGIRSATFAVGALQAMQSPGPTLPDGSQVRSELSRARYLTAVSGGAYAAGAFLLAAHPPMDERSNGDGSSNGEATARNGHDPAHAVSVDINSVFAPGSPEFDYLRQHGSYIADSPKEWTIATLTVLRGAAFSTFFLSLLAIVLGRWMGYLYRDIGQGGDFVSPWEPIWGAALATAVVAGLAILLWLLKNSTHVTAAEGLRRFMDEGVVITTMVIAVLVLVLAVVPVVSWASVQLIDLGGGGSLTTGTTIRTNQVVVGVTKGGIIGAVGAISTILGMLNRQRVEVKKTLQPTAERARKLLGDTGRRIVRAIPVFLGLALIASVYLVFFGFSAYTTAKTDPSAHPLVAWGSPQGELPLSNAQVTVTLTVLLFIAYLFIDETAAGLHPFYRRRLANAFAVRRFTSDRPGGFEARPYEWADATDLEKFGDPDPANRGQRLHPQVIFCASAHCSDPDMTPPGRHVLPFTFSFDALGGPDVGWCSIAEMRERVSRRLRFDLTVETAMAVSGAAFSSGSGSNRIPANVILGLANARLGTWVANPEYMRENTTHWWRARPPIIRRMSFMLREIFALHPYELPMLFVTDGANYENLGLVELLRHRCTQIFCLDASTDAQTFAAAIAAAIALAYDELGVVVSIDHPEMVDPASAGETDAREDLQGRIARKPVLTGTVTYPATPDAPETTGVLVIGRTTLDPQTPWEILRYAAAHPLFPHDATGDQWFDDGKFNAYTGLGRHVGQLAVAEMDSKVCALASNGAGSRPPTRAHQVHQPAEATEG
jgi:hypothetical protein